MTPPIRDPKPPNGSEPPDSIRGRGSDKLVDYRLTRLERGAARTRRLQEEQGAMLVEVVGFVREEKDARAKAKALAEEEAKESRSFWRGTMRDAIKGMAGHAATFLMVVIATFVTNPGAREALLEMWRGK